MTIHDEKNPQIDYQIRDLQSGKKYTFEMFEVSKWSGGRVPETVYHVTRNPVSGRCVCDCPAAFRGKCKHVDMIVRYLSEGRPATFPALEKFEGIS